jgi:hypothetical protein
MARTQFLTQLSGNTGIVEESANLNGGFRGKSSFQNIIFLSNKVDMLVQNKDPTVWLDGARYIYKLVKITKYI